MSNVPLTVGSNPVTGVPSERIAVMPSSSSADDGASYQNR